MVYLFTALYCEAHIFIQQFKLIRKQENTWFQEFYNETSGIRLIITGVGEIAAAAAVGSVCSVYKPTTDDFLVNVGICAHTAENDGIFLCNKIIEKATGKTFYPDMLYRHNFCEGTIVTGMLPWKGDNNSTKIMTATLFGSLYDMEAAAIYQAGSRFFGPHQMIFLKIVSDNGSVEDVSKERTMYLMEKYQDCIFDYIELLSTITQKNRNCQNSPYQEEILETFCTDLHCSKAMRDSMRQYIRYLALTGADYISVIEDMYEKGLLPCKDKREGKLRFEEFILLNDFTCRTTRLHNADQLPWQICSRQNSALCSIKEDYFNPFFSHIYVEKSVRNHARTQKILAKFPSAEIIEIDHYKDVFCRSRQNYQLQHCTQKLILAARQGTLLYEGAPVCQSFGNQYFYYVSCTMNCVFDCEYCYLKGMYPSANIVVFVNLEDTFAEVEQMLEKHPLYLCISYDTDLLALESMIGYVQEWCNFVEKHENLKIEIRTKCANKSFIRSVIPIPGVIYAFTLSPQAVIEAFEHQTTSLTERLSCVEELIRAECPVRLCFDPMIYVPDWKLHYEKMLEQVYRIIDIEKIVDVSVGTFRISQDYLKNMRKQAPNSAVIWFPFKKENGYCHYPNHLMEEMECFLTEKLAEKIPKEKIFRWKE